MMATENGSSDEEISENDKENSRFATLSEKEKEDLMKNRKAKNTNRATKQWTNAFRSYLKAKKLPNLDLLTIDELPDILGDYYFSLRQKPEKNKVPGQKTTPKCYKNSSLKSGRAALNRYFKDKLGIDIISNEKFLLANEQFQAVTKKGKDEGRSEMNSKDPICDEDMAKITAYFEKNMLSKPDAEKVQEMVVFMIIYYGARRGCENLREMTKDKFKIETDHSDGRRYIRQVIKESDKNHNEKDMSNSNEARIYEQPGS